MQKQEINGGLLAKVNKKARVLCNFSQTFFVLTPPALSVYQVNIAGSRFSFNLDG